MSEAMLVFYDRPDSAGAKLSEYQCVSVIQPENLKVGVLFVIKMLTPHSLKHYIPVARHTLQTSYSVTQPQSLSTTGVLGASANLP